MKKLLAILLCLAMLLCIVPLSATAADIAEETPTVTSTPTGTAITNENGLSAITGSGDFYLDEDIYVDLSTATLPLIANGFTGTLDGNGHSILFNNQDGTTTGANGKTNEKELTEQGGIVFHYVSINTLKNITIGSPDVPVILTASHANIGILARQTTAACTFKNVTVYGEVNANREGAMNQSLFIGKSANNLTMENCRAIGRVTVTGQHADLKKLGGFLGTYCPAAQNGAGLTLNMTNCVSNVEIKAASGITVSKSSYAGGLIGHVACSSHPNIVKLTNCMSMQLPVLTNSAGNSANCGILYGGVEGTVGGGVTETNCIDGTTLEDDLALTTARVAGIRFYDPTGIRFLSSVSATYDNLVAVLGADNVKLGTLIAPKAFVDNATAFTKEALDELDVDPAYVTIDYTADEWYAYTGTDAVEGANYYTGAIADIKEANYDVNYCGIGYVSYTLDGNTWATIYADYAADADGSTSIPAFNIRDLAEAAVADAATNPDKYTAAQLDALQKYLPADDAE